ncbi:hypothetical protein FRC16_002271 [Serendipita sp. 398]|nr:hypothetical protein FRC16_002271 [Serendipita sp. 398]
MIGLAVSQSGTAAITFTATVITSVPAPTRSSSTSSSRSTSLRPAATDLNGGGNGGAPSPGSGGQDVFGPDDNYIAGASKTLPTFIATAAGVFVTFLVMGMLEF